MRVLRWPSNLLRGLYLFAFLAAVGVVYAVGRLLLWMTVREPELRLRRIARWRGRVMRRSMSMLGATFIKMGQVLSSRPDLLPPETIAELELLQDRLPGFGFRRVRRLVERELGRPLDQIFSEIDREPVAAASVAQVHRARLVDGGVEVAVKVLRPSIRRQVERDAAVLLFAARLLALHPRIRLSDPVGHLRRFVDAIVAQTDLTGEADNYERFAANFRGDREIRFPAVHRQHSSRSTLTMEFVRGTRFDSRDRSHDRELAATIRRLMLEMCFDHGFVHADLHPGNFFVREDRKLVVFDAGMATLLGDDVFVQFVDFTRCLTTGTADDFVEHIKRFHSYIGEIDWNGLRTDIAGLLGGMRAKNTARLEFSKLFAGIFAIARTYRVRPMPDLTLVMVALLTVQGIGKELDPDSNVFREAAAYLLPRIAQQAARRAASAG